MRIGPARLAQVLEAEPAREVSVEEARALPRGAVPVIKKIRDHHHNIARCAALGMRPGEIANALGMSPNSVSTLLADQAMRDLVEHYRSSADESWKLASIGVMGQMIEIQAGALTLVAEQIEEAKEGKREIPLRTLLSTISDLSDRIGYSKHSIVTVDNSFAAKLDRAIDRSSKVIEGHALAVGESSPEGQEVPQHSVLSGERRRV